MQSRDPAIEGARLRALHDLDILDSRPEADFDELVGIAAKVCDTPISLLTLIDSDRQWFKARFGSDLPETPRNSSFCNHALDCAGSMLLVEDTTLDPRFADHPMVTGAPWIRSYAGAPLVDRGGHTLGTLCVIDRRPRMFEAEQRSMLRALARQAMNDLELRVLRRSTRDASALIAGEQRERMEYLAAIGEASVELQVFIDRNYIYRYTNPVYDDYWGAKPGSVVGRTVGDVIGATLFQQRIRPLLDRALAGETLHHRTRIHFPNKGPRCVESTLKPARNKSGEVIGTIATIHDIDDLERTRTELMHTVAALEQTIVAQKQFIHVVSHDLREPLNSILNFSSLVLEDYRDRPDPLAIEYVGYIQQGGRRMKALVDDLLAYLRLETKRDALEALDIGGLLREIETDLAGSIADSGGCIERGDLCTIIGQRTLIRLLLQNLISNALKFRRQGVAPRVRVSAVDHGNYWELAVVDNGIGIASEHHAAIFDLFHRLHSSDRFEGTGLGLAICRRIAEMHSGSISVESVEGVGSRFLVRLAKVSGQEP